MWSVLDCNPPESGFNVPGSWTTGSYSLPGGTVTAVVRARLHRFCVGLLLAIPVLVGSASASHRIGHVLRHRLSSGWDL